jgi:hypothetical protein
VKNYPGVLRRFRKLYVKVKDPDKGWTYMQAVVNGRPLEIGQEAAALAFRHAAQNALDAGVELGLGGDDTVANYFARRVLPQRKAMDVKTWDDEEGRFKLHIEPLLGKMALSEVQPRHVNGVIEQLRAAKKASRTVRNVYHVMRTIFRLAQIDGLTSSSPCILTRAELGKIKDKHKEWRAGAIYSREELVELISDERIPWDRRVYYATAGLGMMRLGEVSGLRFRHHQRELEPLGRLVIAGTYADHDTKTGVERWMPVHPVLAAMLAEWKLRGWPEMMGRRPGPDDFIFPTPMPTNRGPRVKWGSVRDENWTWKRLRNDLKMLGRRHRRVHDLRATGISLAQDDGAEKNKLGLCTHQPPKDVISLYTRLGWGTLCAQVSCLKIERPKSATPATA